MKCCSKDKKDRTSDDNNKRVWGKCVKSCLSSGGNKQCPKDSNNNIRTCKQPENGKCNNFTDCLNGKYKLAGSGPGIKCCKGRCLNMNKDTCDYALIGEKCKIASDCEGWGSLGKTNYYDKQNNFKKTKHVTCCTDNGSTKSNNDEHGYCTPSCVNTGIGHCPKTSIVSCEKQLGEECNTCSDCLGWTCPWLSAGISAGATAGLGPIASLIAGGAALIAKENRRLLFRD